MINKKIFLNGINQDDSFAIVDKADYLNAVNMRFATSENGKAGQLSKIEGNVLKNARIGGTFTLPGGTNECIGAYEDVPSRRIFYFNKNSNGSHGIYCYDADTDLNYTVLLSSQVVGGLGFSSFVHSIAMVDNLLFWTDNVNPQRRINVEAGIKLNQATYSTTVSPYVLDKNSSGGSGSTHMSSSVITLIRNQPWAPLTAVKVNDAAYVNNFIKDEAFQFTYRFVYRDGEVSTFSPLSRLLNYNTAAENTAPVKNAIDVTIPLGQKIEQDVVSVEIGVRYALDGNVLIMKTFTSGFTTHNSGTALTFRFYNDTVGVSVDSASSVKPFDSIPRTSKTLEIAKSRLFLGNNVDGYDTPTTTSLTVKTAEAGSGTVNGQWYKIVYRSGGVTIIRYWLYIVDITTNPGYYVPPTQPSLPIPTTAVSYTSLTFAGGGVAAIAAYLGIPASDVLGLTYQGPTVTITGATASSVVGVLAFKSAASYRAGIVFFDSAGRKSGVVTNDTIVASTPDRTFNSPAFVTRIDWSLDNNNNPAAQIPDWATHYAVVRTKCLRASSFFQLKSDALEYAIKDATTGVLSYSTSYLASHYGIAINAKSLFSNNLGYQYEAGSGDIAKLYVSSPTQPYALAVKDQEGEKIIVDLQNLGSLSGVTALYEIYTPYISTTTEPYFEVGDIYQIEHPGQNTRRFSTINGSFRGDIFLLERVQSATPYVVEAMSPNDKYWRNWFTDIGRATIVLSIGTTSKPVSIYYSNVILQGTRTNGLSTFEAPSQTNLPTELKQINRLMLTSKVQFEGTVMLAVGEQETASIYIGEAQIFDNTGNSFLATTTGVIGNVNIMKGSFGTINPESVYKWKGEVMYFDANKGSWVRYNANGLFPISANKMTKYFRKVGQDIISYFRSPAEYNYANPDFSLRVLGAVDPYHEEYLCHVPKMSVSARNTILADMDLSRTVVAFATVNGSVTVDTPTMSFSYVQGSGPSATQTSNYTGVSLSLNGTLTATAPANFEVSFDNVNFAGTATSPIVGINKSGIVYIRMKAALTGGSYGPSNLTLSDGTNSATIALSGTVTVPVTPLLNTSTSVLGGFTYVLGSGPSTAQSFTVSASNLTPSSGNITITPSTNYEVSVTSSTTGFSSSPVTLAYTSGGTLAANTVWVRLKAGLSAASYNSETVTVSGGGATTKNVTCSGLVSSGATPTIYSYTNSGYGLSESAACDMASIGLTTLTSSSDPSSFGPGSVVYTNPSGTTPLTGYTHIYMNGANWDIDPTYGVVIAYSLNQC